MALRACLTVLIDELGDEADHKRVELIRIRTLLCRVYRLADPRAPARDVEVAQDLAEEDGDDVSE